MGKKRPMSQVARDLMGRKNATIKSEKDKGTRSEHERKAREEWTEQELAAWREWYDNQD